MRHFLPGNILIYRWGASIYEYPTLETMAHWASAGRTNNRFSFGQFECGGQQSPFSPLPSTFHLSNSLRKLFFLFPFLVIVSPDLLIPNEFSRCIMTSSWPDHRGGRQVAEFQGLGPGEKIPVKGWDERVLHLGVRFPGWGGAEVEIDPAQAYHRDRMDYDHDQRQYSRWVCQFWEHVHQREGVFAYGWRYMEYLWDWMNNMSTYLLKGWEPKKYEQRLVFYPTPQAPSLFGFKKRDNFLAIFTLS